MDRLLEHFFPALIRRKIRSYAQPLLYEENGCLVMKTTSHPVWRPRQSYFNPSQLLLSSKFNFDYLISQLEKEKEIKGWPSLDQEYCQTRKRLDRDFLLNWQPFDYPIWEKNVADGIDIGYMLGLDHNCKMIRTISHHSTLTDANVHCFKRWNHCWVEAIIFDDKLPKKITLDINGETFPLSPLEIENNYLFLGFLPSAWAFYTNIHIFFDRELSFSLVGHDVTELSDGCLCNLVPYFQTDWFHDGHYYHWTAVNAFVFFTKQ